MPNPFAKSRPTMSPYAIYICGDFVWHVVKTYKTVKSEDKDPYARWLVAAKSDNTFGSFEGGDTYRSEVERYGTLVAATPEWLEAYGITKPYLPTPDEYLRRRSTMTRYHAVLLDETGCEFGHTFTAGSRDEAWDEIRGMFPESQCVQLESAEDTARREEALYARIAAEWNDDTQDLY